MDTATIILTALIAGTAKVAGDAVPDAYKGLKELILKKFAGKPAAEMVLDEHEKDPETYAAPLKKNLIESGIDKDEEIIKAAKELLEQLKSQELASGTVNIGQGAKGVIGQNISGSTINQGNIS
jgi:hypothetical protein